jgi:hypothetical protein
MDIYFFKDGGGNFAPANYRIEYLSSDNTWHAVKNAMAWRSDISTTRQYLTL